MRSALRPANYGGWVLSEAFLGVCINCIMPTCVTFSSSKFLLLIARQNIIRRKGGTNDKENSRWDQTS